MFLLQKAPDRTGSVYTSKLKGHIYSSSYGWRGPKRIRLYASDSQTLFPNPVSLCSALMMAQTGTFVFCSVAHILLYSACQGPLAGAVNPYDPPGVLPLCFRKGRAMLSFLPKLCSLQGDLPPLSPTQPSSYFGWDNTGNGRGGDYAFSELALVINSW